MGEELGRWARGESIQNPHEELWARGTVEAETGTGALRTFWLDCSKAERRALRPINERLKVTALTKQTASWASNRRGRVRR